MVDYEASRINKNGYIEVRMGKDWKLLHRLIY